jgi:ABC-type methionine transport system permease subunit
MNEEKKQIEKDLEAVVNTDIQKTELSSNFSHLVMQKVEAAELKKAGHNMPMVGFTGWLVFGIFGLLMALTFFIKGEGNSFRIELPDIDYNHLWSTYYLIPFVFLAVAILIFVDILIRKRSKKTA